MNNKDETIEAEVNKSILVMLTILIILNLTVIASALLGYFDRPEHLKQELLLVTDYVFIFIFIVINFFYIKKIYYFDIAEYQKSQSKKLITSTEYILIVAIIALLVYKLAPQILKIIEKDFVKNTIHIAK